MNGLTRYDGLIAIASSAAVLIGYVWGVVQPSQLKAKSIQHEIQQTQSNLKDLPTRIIDQDQIQAQLEQRRKRNELLVAMIPIELDEADVLSEVAALAHQSSVTIVRLEPQAQRELATYSALPFALIVRGEFAGVTQFLSGLETHSRLVTFEEVKLQRGVALGERQVQAIISLSVYSRHADSARVAENAASRDAPSSDN